MIGKIVITLAVAFLIIYTPNLSAFDEICSGNLTYNECGSACPPKCGSLASVQMCTMQCVIGCYCGGEYATTQDGRCVLKEDCPKK
uniref:TIL domain-containing protein n=1 Tax=Rhabditophanes sp. KR3021 TaxID=114890 RepID=A0AC35TSG8_9BILA